MPKVQHANHITLTYSGHDKYTATWQGWPTDGHKIVRRTIQLDANDNRELAALRAAALFAQWLETGPMGDGHICEIEAVTMGGMDSRRYAVGVQTHWARKAGA